MKVHYIDGEKEDLTLSSLQVLLRNESWRLQVLLAQAYVHAFSTVEGYYSHKPKV
jgi:hypothetical protein